MQLLLTQVLHPFFRCPWLSSAADCNCLNLISLSSAADSNSQTRPHGVYKDLTPNLWTQGCFQILQASELSELSLNTAFEVGINFIAAKKPSVQTLTKSWGTVCISCLAQQWMPCVALGASHSLIQASGNSAHIGTKARVAHLQPSSLWSVTVNMDDNCLPVWKFGRKTGCTFTAKWGSCVWHSCVITEMMYFLNPFYTFFFYSPSLFRLTGMIFV